MKRLPCLMAAAVLSISLWGTAASAAIIGALWSATGGGMTATGDWDNGGAFLSWKVYQNDDGDWVYKYDFNVKKKDTSHIIIGVSPTFTPANILDGTTPGWELGTWGDAQGNSNPGIPGDLYGLKFPGDGLSTSFTIVSDRSPRLVNAYAKDGTTEMGSIDVYAYNALFGTEPDQSMALMNPTTFGYALGPDTITAVPLPSALLLFAAALAALSLVGRRRLFTLLPG